MDSECKLIDLNQIATVEELIRRREDICSRYNDFVGELAKRRSHLQEALRFGYWNKDAEEIKKFLEDKIIFAKAETSGSTTADLVALNDLESEINSNKKSLERLVNSGNEMIQDDHYAKTDIQRTIDNLNDLWSQLEELLNKKRKRLEHEQKLDCWREKSQKIQIWIEEKLPTAENENYGESIGEVNALKDALLRLQNEINGFSTSMGDLKKEAEELELESEYEKLDEKWQKLQSEVSKRKDGLEKSFNIQTFLEECRTAVIFLKARNELLGQSVIGDNVPSLEQTLRNHQRSYQELKCFEPKIKHFETRANELGEATCTETFESLEAMWNDINSDYASHEEKLKDALRRTQFSDDTEKMVQWAESMSDQIKNVSLPENAQQAENIIQEHEGRKGEIDSNEAKYEELLNEGKELDLDSQELIDAIAELKKCWKEKHEIYAESMDYFKFIDSADEKITWLDATRNDIESQLGTGLDTLEATEKTQLKQHGINTLIEAQSEPIKALHQVENSFDQETLETKKNDLKEAEQKLEDVLKTRNDEICLASKKHKFMSDADELDAIIDEKLDICGACDARELSDLTQKMQNNQNLRNEIVANQIKMENLQRSAEDLISTEEKIKEKLDDVQDKWDRLQTMVHEKEVELDEAAVASAYIRGREEFEGWLDQIEPQVNSKEYGKDLPSAKQLLNQHKALTENVKNQKPKIDSLEDQLEQLKNAKNFMAGELEEKTKQVANRYESLQSPLDEREEQLQQAVADLELLQGINEQIVNTAEQQTLLKNDFKPKDIVSAETALAKNANLKSEYQSSQPVVEKLKSDADKCENQEVKSAANQLMEDRDQLLASINEKDEELKNKVKSFKYISDANEANDFIQEKLKEATIETIGSDEDEADALLKKHLTLCDDITAFKKRIDDLDAQRSDCTMQKIELEPDKIDMKVIEPYQAQLSREVSVKEGDVVQLLSNPGGEWVKIGKDNLQGYIPAQCLAHINDAESDQEVIDLAEVQTKLNADYQVLHENAEERKDTLEKLNLKYELEREADDLKQWIKTQEDALRKAQEAGEDPEALRQKFEQFQKDQKQAEKLFDDLKEKAGVIGVKESPSLQAMEEQWQQLENKAIDTESQIGGASRLKQFLGEAGQLATWIEKKNEDIEEPESINQTKALIRRQQALDADMEALEAKLKDLNSQKEKLGNDLPESKEQIESTLNALNTEWKALNAQQECVSDAD